MSATEILPNLWLGSILAAKNKSFFDANNINIVVNCSTDIPFYSNYTVNVRVPVNDNLKPEEIEKLLKYLPITTDFINKNLLNGKNILVHCYAGKQRSAAMIAAYLIKYANMTVADSIQSIQTKRAVAFQPSINFRKSLHQFEAQLV